MAAYSDAFLLVPAETCTSESLEKDLLADVNARNFTFHAEVYPANAEIIDTVYFPKVETKIIYVVPQGYNLISFKSDSRNFARNRWKERLAGSSVITLKFL